MYINISNIINIIKYNKIKCKINIINLITY